MIEKKLLLQAVKTLREANEKYYADPSKKKPLLDGETEHPIYLQISLKKIPNSKSIKMIKINLPHRLIKDSTEICLITGDVDKKNRKAEIEPDILHYKNLLDEHSITAISEVFTLRQLRTEYKPYEAKQKLLAAYDIFLADSKIAECLPKVLGRHFFKKRKFPIQINMKSPNLKQQVEKALSTKVFYVTGHGNSCASEVAYLDMSDSEIFDNVVAVAKTLCDQLPGSWDNVMGMYLKTPLSKAIPLYMSYDDPSKVLMNDDDDDDESVEVDELSTVPNVDVKVYKDGKVEAFSRKRKIEVDEDSKENSQDVSMEVHVDDEDEDSLVTAEPSSTLNIIDEKCNSLHKKNKNELKLKAKEQDESPELKQDKKKSKRMSQKDLETEEILLVSKNSDCENNSTTKRKKSLRLQHKNLPEVSLVKNSFGVEKQDESLEPKQDKKKSKRISQKNLETEEILFVSENLNSENNSKGKKSLRLQHKKLQESSFIENSFGVENSEQEGPAVTKTPSKKSKRISRKHPETEEISLVSENSNSEIGLISESNKTSNFESKKLEDSSVIENSFSVKRSKEVSLYPSKRNNSRSKPVGKNSVETEIFLVSNDSDSDSVTEISSTSKSKNKKLQAHSSVEGIVTEKKEPTKSNKKSKSKRKGEEMLINEAVKNTTHSPLQVTKKKKGRN